MKFHPLTRSLPRRKFSHRSGFTLVELMIIVALISLISAMALPNYLRGRKRAQATRILEDLRLIDSAMEQYAMENQMTDGVAIPWTSISPYMKNNSNLSL